MGAGGDGGLWGVLAMACLISPAVLESGTHGCPPVSQNKELLARSRVLPCASVILGSVVFSFSCGRIEKILFRCCHESFFMSAILAIYFEMIIYISSLVAQTLKCLPTMRETWAPSPGLGRSPGEGNGNPVFLPGESEGRRSVVGYSPWGCKELDTTERLLFPPY